MHIVKPIILIGMMGAGKTTVGRALANTCRCPFYDLDCEIERSADCSIAQIFERQGETAFRQLECEKLQAVLQKPAPFVLSTGGGIVETAKCRELIAQSGQVIYLEASLATLVQRIVGNKKAVQSRPLLQENPEEVLKARLVHRHPLYQQVAHACLKTDKASSVDHVVQGVLAELSHLSER